MQEDGVQYSIEERVCTEVFSQRSQSDAVEINLWSAFHAFSIHHY